LDDEVVTEGLERVGVHVGGIIARQLAERPRPHHDFIVDGLEASLRHAAVELGAQDDALLLVRITSSADNI